MAGGALLRRQITNSDDSGARHSLKMTNYDDRIAIMRKLGVKDENSFVDHYYAESMK